MMANQDLEFMREQNWTIVVVNSEDANAYVLPTGHIFVYGGLLKFCQSDDQLAVVLGHEMSHAILGTYHWVKIYWGVFVIKKNVFAVEDFLERNLFCVQNKFGDSFWGLALYFIYMFVKGIKLEKNEYSVAKGSTIKYIGSFVSVHVHVYHYEY